MKGITKNLTITKYLRKSKALKRKSMKYYTSNSEMTLIHILHANREDILGLILQSSLTSTHQREDVINIHNTFD
jgi:3-dehydroquinate dehydratase